MTDVHCHLNFHAYKDDVDTVINDAFAKGVTKIINVGTKIDSSIEAVKLADRYDNLYAIVGVHPHHADKISQYRHPELDSGSQGIPDQVRNDNNNWIEELDKLAPHPKVLAIGEIGLDFYRYKSNGIVDPQLQRETFIRQIELANRHSLPLQIHNRHAGEEVIRILKEHKDLLQPVPGMFHCFAGSMQVLHDALELGFYIGFDGNTTYPGLAPGENTDLRDLAKETPLDRLVIETDAPYLTPVPHRGQRNIPSYVIITAHYIADLKGISFDELVEQTDKNVYTVFTRMQ